MDCSALSPSRISTNKNCEFKYFLQYHLRLPQARESNIYGIKGTAAHLALEYYGNAIRAGNEDGDEASLDYEKTLKDFYKETQLWKLDDREGTRRDGSVKGWPHPVEKYCEACPWATKDSVCSIAGIPFKNVEGCPKPNFEDDFKIVKDTVESTDWKVFEGKILGTEVQFGVELEGGVKVRGVIDLVLEEDEDTLEIVDYKSGNSTKGYDAARKDPQMRIYNMIAKTLWKEYGTYLTSLYYIRKKKYVSCVFSEEDDKATLRAVTKHWNKIRANQNPYRPSRKFWLCDFCIGYDACGIIQNSHIKNRRFKLPVIDCSHKGDTLCWGSLGVENPNSVTVFNTDKMIYACAGHYEIHKGGEYVVEPDSD